MTTLSPRTPAEYLADISSWVSSVQEPNQLLELIIETAARMMRAKASSLLLVDEDGKKLSFEFATGSKKNAIKKIDLKMGQGIAGYVAETGKPLLVEDVTKDPRWYKPLSIDIGFKTRSIACSPMRSDSRIVGVLQIINRLDNKPFDYDDLNMLTVFANVAAKALVYARIIESVNRKTWELTEQVIEKYQIVGTSKKVKAAVSDALKVAKSKASVMILGESGTGKELMARMIHMQSARKEFPLVIINCGALAESLLEDELFGHEKGAYTGAVSRKQGKFELADKGTLFLDEVGEMNLNMQTRLLRVLQEGTYYRVGGNTSVTVDVRIVAATNRDIKKEVQEGGFREDLYYRLNVVQIKMPPLRERKDDILVLANYFLDKFKKEKGEPNLQFSHDAQDMLVNHRWGGNIRELKNAVERAVIMCDGTLILPDDLPFSKIVKKLEEISINPGEPGLTLKLAVDRFKKEFIASTLKAAQGNRTRTAEVLGIQRTYLSRLITDYNLREK